MTSFKEGCTVCLCCLDHRQHFSFINGSFYFEKSSKIEREGKNEHGGGSIQAKDDTLQKQGTGAGGNHDLTSQLVQHALNTCLCDSES